MRTLLAIVWLTCAPGAFAQSKKTPHNFSAQLGAYFYKSDTVSFSLFDHSGLRLDVRISLLNRAIRESGADTMGPAILAGPFDTSGFLQCKGDVSVLDLNGNKEKDLVFSYDNGDNNRSAFYFLREKGRFKKLTWSGGDLRHVQFKNGRLDRVCSVSYACCTHAYDLYTEERYTTAFTSTFKNVRVPTGWEIVDRKLLYNAYSKKDARLRPSAKKHSDEPKAAYSGTTTLTENTPLGIYEEKEVGGVRWLLAMACEQNSHYYLGWIPADEIEKQ